MKRGQKRMENKPSSGRKVLINSIIYSCSGLLLKCFSFFLLPLYTVYLTTEDYGINSVITSFISTASFIVAFSLFSAVMRFYVDLKEEPEKLKRFYGTISLFVFFSGTAFAVVLTIFRQFTSKYLFSGIDYYPFILVALISLVFNCEYTIFDNILRSQQRALKSSICSIIYFFVSVALNIFFVVCLKMGALGTLLASLIAYLLYTAYFVIEMSVTHTIKFCMDLKLLKDALKYSIPIMPHNLSTQIALFVSKLLISDVGSLADLGVYSVATQFGNIADTIQCYVDSAYGPWLYERLHNKENKYKKTIRQNVKLLIAVIGLFFVGISLFAQDYIVLFLQKSYVGAWMYVPMIVSVFAIKTTYYFYVEILFYYKEASRKLFIATLTGSVLNILLSAIFIPIWSVYGSILADAIAMLVRVIIVVAISRKYEDVGLRIRDFVIIFVIIELFIFMGLILSIMKFQTTFSIFNFGYKIVVVFLYVIMIFVMNRESAMVLLANFKEKRKNK